MSETGVYTIWKASSELAGGANMRVLNGVYPNEVAGMVLVDAWHEDEIARLPRHKGPGPDYLRPAIDALTPTFNTIGLIRLFRPPLRNEPPTGLTVEQWSIMQRLRRQPKATAAESSSGMTQDQSNWLSATQRRSLVISVQTTER